MTINTNRPGNKIGTGVVIKREGDRTLVLTNRHVIFDGDVFRAESAARNTASLLQSHVLKRGFPTPDTL